MSRSITLSPHVYSLVANRASQEHTTPDALAERVLCRELGDDDWRQAFDALVRRVHSRTRSFTSEEIEADISAASAEVKEQRRANRRS